MIINLFIVRHGHSPFIGGDDFTRPLSAQGEAEAINAGIFIAKKITTGAVTLITSAAQRTHTTAKLICQSLEDIQPEKDTKLYHATVGNWCDVITNNPTENLILVGHNPTISQLHQYLTQSATVGYTPATIGHLTLEIVQDGLKLPALQNQLQSP